MQKIRIGCVGAGYFAGYHIDAWSRIAGVEVVAICDKELHKADELSTRYKVLQTFDDMDAMLRQAEIDVVDIITPPDTHLEMVKHAMARDKHVICQKPLAPSIEEAQQITQITLQNECRFMVHENFRFQPWHRQLKKCLDDQSIGDINRIYHRIRLGDGWQADAYMDRQPYFRTMPRLLIYETGVHFIDVMRFLGGEIDSVYARLKRYNPAIKGEDSALVMLEFANGAEGIIDASRYHESTVDNPRYTFGAMTIDGSKGSLYLDENGGIQMKLLGQEAKSINYYHEDVGFAGDCVYATQAHFVDGLLNDRPFETEASDYLNNLMIQEAIYQSDQSKSRIVIEPINIHAC